MPWVGVEWDADNGVIILTIRNPRVSPTDVAVAYRSLRDAFFGRKRRGSEWPHVAEAFVAELEKADGRPGWKSAFEKFKARHPDQPYDSLQSFRQAVYDFRNRPRKQ